MDFDGENHRRNRYTLNSTIMITALSCFFSLVLALVVMHFYGKYVRRRQEMRRQTNTTAAQVNNSSEDTRAGLDAAVVASLPMFTYKVDDQADKVGYIERDCAVCLSNLEEGEVARLLPNCKHMFHSQCIDAWLRAHSTCPICRTEAKPRDSVEVAVVVSAAALPADIANPSAALHREGSSDELGQPPKVLGSSSRLSSFRRMLSRERSSIREEPSGQTDSIRDLETQ